MRKRVEAMEQLTRIEVQFAKLRDQLYIDRMGEIERERLRVEAGESCPRFVMIVLTQLARYPS